MGRNKRTQSIGICKSTRGGGNVFKWGFKIINYFFLWLFAASAKMSQIRVKITVFVCMIQRIDAMRLRNSMSERRNKSGIERLGRIWCCWQFFLLQFAHHGFTLDEKDRKKTSYAEKRRQQPNNFCNPLIAVFNDLFILHTQKVSFYNPSFNFYLASKCTILKLLEWRFR